MKKKIALIIAAVIPIIVLIGLDFFNVTKVFPFTKNYDWLAFVGTYIAGVCTLFLGIVTIKQNGALSDLHKQMLNNDMITTRFSQIDIERENYFDQNLRDNYENAYGVKMKNADIESSESKKYTRFILQIKDKYSLPLMCGKIDKLEVFYNYEKAYVNESKRTYISNGEEVKLEVTPHEDKITYYLPICFIDDDDILKAINDSQKLRIVATIEIKNAFNVVSKAEFTIHFSNEKKNSEDWTHYRSDGRKVYYKEIKYDSNK